MLFMPDSARIKYRNGLSIYRLAPLSTAEMSGNDKAVVRPTRLFLRIPSANVANGVRPQHLLP